MTIGDTTERCIWAMLTYQDSTGAVRVIEIPIGNTIDVTIEETRPDPYAIGVEADLLSIPPVTLPKLLERGVKITIGVQNSGSDAGYELVRVHGRP